MGPDFICIGAQKAGSTWLYDQARSHPRVWMPPIKEVRYFSALGGVKERAAIQLAKYELLSRPMDPRKVEFVRRLARAEGPKNGNDLTEYMALFEPAGDAVTGDISPGYVRMPDDLAKKLAAALPDCKFLFLIREPAARLWSQLNMMVRTGRLGRRALTHPRRLLKLTKEEAITAYSYQSQTIKTWRALVGEERFKVFVMDELYVEADGFRRRIFDYLGLNADECTLPANHNRKTTELKIPVTDEMRGVLDKVFADERRELVRLVGGATQNWSKN